MANVSIEQDCFQEGVSVRNFQNARRFVPRVPRYELWLWKHGSPALLLHRNGLRAGFSGSLTPAGLSVRAFFDQRIENGNKDQRDECGGGKSTQDDASHRGLN